MILIEGRHSLPASKRASPYEWAGKEGAGYTNGVLAQLLDN